MSFSWYRLSGFFFILTIVALLYITYDSYLRLKTFIDYNDRVTLSKEIQYELENLLSQIKDAETGQRGFIITADSIFLEPYAEAKPEIINTFNTLDSLVGNKIIYRVRLDRLRELTRERLSLMEESRNSYVNNSILFRQKFLMGKQKMDELRSFINRMLSDENKELMKFEELKKKYETITPFFLWLLAISAILLITFSYYIIRRQLHDRIMIQHELENKIEALNRSNEELEQFAYVASHDLQEPLRKIQAFGDKLTGKYAEALGEEGSFLIGRMSNAAERMQSLINDLLSFSRVIHNREKKKELVNLKDVIRDVISNLQILIDEKKATIKLAPDLPTIEAVDSQMIQLFQNLIGNALKFSKENIAPVIRISSHKVMGRDIKECKVSQLNQAFYQVQVQDNGIGFDEQYLDKIFVIFQRLHGKLDYPGTGIGLAICKKIVVNHDGYISASGIPGNGATFTVYLPAG